MKKTSSGKVNGSHSTYIEAADPIIEAANRLPHVTKVSLGFINRNLHNAPHRLKCFPINGGIKLVVRGGNSMQEVFVYTNDSVATQKALEKAFK